MARCMQDESMELEEKALLEDDAPSSLPRRPVLAVVIIAGVVALMGFAGGHQAWMRSGGVLVASVAEGGLKDSSQLACDEAEVQSPREVSFGVRGQMSARGIEPLSSNVLRNLVHVNTHFHLGAEHKSKGEYDQAPPENLNTNPTSHHELRPGWFCDTTSLTSTQKRRYKFQYCEGVEVGTTYEVHSVWSTGGQKMADGLGGAFARDNNAFVVVQGQVFVLVNDESHDSPGLAKGWNATLAREDSVKYLGSTTGTKYDNKVCSPYSVSWHVDRKCHLLSARSFDKMCKDLKAEDIEHDLVPHPSRELVSKKYVAKREYDLKNV